MVLAHLTIGAVGVGVALKVAAGDGVGLGNEARLALADSIFVCINGAGGVGSAGMWDARVLASES